MSVWLWNLRKGRTTRGAHSPLHSISEILNSTAGSTLEQITKVYEAKKSGSLSSIVAASFALDPLRLLVDLTHLNFGRSIHGRIKLLQISPISLEQ